MSYAFKIFSKVGRQMAIVLCLLGTILIFLEPRPTAATIGVSPARMEFALKAGAAATQKIFLQNLDQVPRQVQIQVGDKAAASLIKIDPAGPLTLPPQAIISVEVKLAAPQTTRAALQISELPDSGGPLSLTAGVRIPVVVTAAASAAADGRLSKTLLSGALAALATVLTFWKFRKKRLQMV